MNIDYEKAYMFVAEENLRLKKELEKLKKEIANRFPWKQKTEEWK